MHASTAIPLFLLALPLLTGLAACEQAASQAPLPPPKVVVTEAVSRDITDWDDFTGRFEAVERVELRPRVSGYIEALRFAEGEEVKKGQLLFTIDAQPYQVALDQAQAQLARAQSQAALARSESERAHKLREAHAISQEEFDRAQSQQGQAQAEQHAAEAAVAAARLNLEYTRVISPIAGRVSHAQITAGNYVNAGQTLLTTVVSLDPIYVVFEGDERSFLKYGEQTSRGERPASRDAANAVYIGLSDETDYPHRGRMNFVDNALDPASGTIRVRALLDNPERRFAPGLFARVRLAGSGRYQATLLPEQAISTDQDRRFVLVVDERNVVQQRPVQVGGFNGPMRVVRSGLKPGELVIVGGLQRVRPGATVTPERATAVADGATVASSR